MKDTAILRPNVATVKNNGEPQNENNGGAPKCFIRDGDHKSQECAVAEEKYIDCTRCEQPEINRSAHNQY